MARTFEIEVPREFLHWATGLGAAMYPTAEEALMMDQAMDFMFTETQARVHVVTGDLKFTGRIVPARVDGDLIEGGIQYGGMVGPVRGKVVGYAEKEFGRGGSHDAITPAMSAAEMVFTEAFVDMVTSMLDRAVGGV